MILYFLFFFFYFQQTPCVEPNPQSMCPFNNYCECIHTFKNPFVMHMDWVTYTFTNYPLFCNQQVHCSLLFTKNHLKKRFLMSSCLMSLVETNRLGAEILTKTLLIFSWNCWQWAKYITTLVLFFKIMYTSLSIWLQIGYKWHQSSLSLVTFCYILS